MLQAAQLHPKIRCQEIFTKEFFICLRLHDQDSEEPGTAHQKEHGGGESVSARDCEQGCRCLPIHR